MTIGNQAFCLIVYSTAVYFRREFQHVGDVIKEKKQVPINQNSRNMWFQIVGGIICCVNRGCK